VPLFKPTGLCTRTYKREKNRNHSRHEKNRRREQNTRIQANTTYTLKKAPIAVMPVKNLFLPVAQSLRAIADGLVLIQPLKGK
jgi:hypothetical protein